MGMKSRLQKEVIAQLERAREDAELEIKKLRQAAAEETKSAMGDKYETAREMIQSELDKQEMVMQNTKRNISSLESLVHKSSVPEIEVGSLVITDKGRFWISVSFGKLMLGEEEYFLISPASPLAQAMLGRKEGEEFEFRNSRYQIEKLS